MTTQSSRNPEGKAIEARPPVGAYLCEPIEKHADYWKKGAWNEPDRAQALICMEQAVNAWKNLAYALARSAHYYAMEHIGRSVESPSETTHNEIVEKCAKAIAKRTQELCSDPEVCYTEHDTGATIINSRYSDHVEALDEAEAIVRALKVPTESERPEGKSR